VLCDLFAMRGLIMFRVALPDEHGQVGQGLRQRGVTA